MIDTDPRFKPYDSDDVIEGIGDRYIGLVEDEGYLSEITKVNLETEILNKRSVYTNTYFEVEETSEKKETGEAVYIRINYAKKNIFGVSNVYDSKVFTGIAE